MNLDQYQTEAMRTATDGEYYVSRLVNCALGISGEGGELADHIKKVVFHEHPLNREYLIKELGDVLWYVAQGAHALGVPLSEVAEENIAKLKRRYPDGFSRAASLFREDE